MTPNEESSRRVKREPRYADYQAAHRVLKAIENHGHPLRVDALVLRLWAGSSAILRPLKEIAKAIVKAEKSQPMPDITQIAGPERILFWANTTAADLWMRQCYATGPKLSFELPEQQTDALVFGERAKRGGFSINVM
jgi:hypothetical protein